MATYIPAPYDPMQEAMLRLGQALGGQLGDKVINPLFGMPTQAQAAQQNTQRLLNFQNEYQQWQQGPQSQIQGFGNLAPGQQQQLQGLFPGTQVGPPQVPQMLGQEGNDMMTKYLAGQQMNPAQQYDLAEAKRTQTQRDKAAKANLEETTSQTRLRKQTMKAIEKATTPGTQEYEMTQAKIEEYKSQTKLNEQKAIQGLIDADQKIKNDYFKNLTQMFEATVNAIAAINAGGLGSEADLAKHKADLLTLGPRLDAAAKAAGMTGQQGNIGGGNSAGLNMDLLAPK